MQQLAGIRITEDFDEEDHGLASISQIKTHMHKILVASQKVYDDWDESDEDTYAGGGICHIIAESICDVLSNAGVECSMVSSPHEQHVYVAVKCKEGVYTIDIPYSIYETGAGFSWQKIPDVQFQERDVVFYQVSRNPGDFDEYTDSW